MAAIAWPRRTILFACTTLVGIAPSGGLVPAAAAAARPATVDAVRSDPHYAAWVAALVAVKAPHVAAQNARTAPPGRMSRARSQRAHENNCATRDGLETQILELHRRRVELLRSLAARDVAPAPAPPGIAPWPWGLQSEPRRTTTADAVRDTLGVSLLHDTGNITFLDHENELEVDPVFAANAFYGGHNDEYDFLVFLTTFHSRLGLSQFGAYYVPVANDVTGLGYVHTLESELFDASDEFTRLPGPGRLQGFANMNRIGAFPEDPNTSYLDGYTPVEILGHQVGHRWLARAWLDITGYGPTAILLGYGLTHWGFATNAVGSPLEGNSWQHLQGRRYSTTAATIAFSPLDLYFMGLMAPDEVDPATLFYLFDVDSLHPALDQYGEPWWWGSRRTPGVSCDATAVPFTIDELALTNGYRSPAYPNARREFRLAVALAWNDDVPVSGMDLAKVERLRDAFVTWFPTATQGRGSIDTHLTSLPARMVFEHRPHGNVEDETQTIAISTRIGLEPRSLPTRLADVGVTLSWSVDGGAVVETPMTSPAPGEFTAELPPQPQGAIVRYSMLATTPLPGHASRWPEAPDATFEFRVSTDDQGPTVQHARRRRWSRLAEPPLFRALVRDEHGVADVRIEYRVAGGALESTPMTVQGVSDVWEARPVFPGRIGDVVEYRIVARDIAATPHETRSPANGFNELQWDRALLEDAEADDPMWTHRSLSFGQPDEWHRDVVSPIEGLYTWKVGPNNRLGRIARPQNSVLESPAIQIFQGGQMRIRHRYAFLRDDFSIDEAWDGAVVQWQDVVRDGPIDRWYLIDPDRAYPFHGFSPGAESPLEGLPCYSGNQGVAIEDSFTFRAWHVNRTVRLRFHVSSSFHPRAASLDGWYIDAIHIDPGPPPTAIAIEGLGAERTAAGVRLSWRAIDVGAGATFWVERAPVDASGVAAAFEPLGVVAAATGIDAYEYVDPAPPPGGLAYRVGIRTGDAVSAWLEVRIATAPRFALHPNVPNPFNPSTRIRFELATAGPARLVVYDVGGRRVRTLVEARLGAGPHEVAWDGCDAAGRAVASGLYWARLESAGQSAVRRLALVR